MQENSDKVKGVWGILILLEKLDVIDFRSLGVGHKQYAKIAEYVLDYADRVVKRICT